MQNESKWYELTKKAIEDEYKNHLYLTDFEITADRKKIPQRFIRNKVLLNYRLPTPDIMGLIWKRNKEENKKLVIIEFKSEPKFKDIFQAKGYDELFDSESTFLLSWKPLFESSKTVLQFIKEKPELLRTKCGKSYIRIMFLHKTLEGKITLAQLGTDIGILPTETFL